MRIPPGQYIINFDDDELESDQSRISSPKKEEAVVSPGGRIDPMRRLRFISLGSGSSGNSYYLGNDRGGIIVDVGVRLDEIEKSMEENGLSMQKVVAVLLTHDHSDHLKFVYTLLRKYKRIALYCTNRVLNAILKRHSISKRIKEYHNPIFKELPFKILDFEITAFEVPHDSSDSVGFSVVFDGRHFVIATDMGHICDRARHYISQANYLVIESNYDRQMLIMGRYPEYLKARILTDRGHMSNADTASFLAEIADEKLKYIFLCHLSEENNTPDKALAATKESLEAKGFRVVDARDGLPESSNEMRLMALPRRQPSPLFVLFPF